MLGDQVLSIRSPFYAYVLPLLCFGRCYLVLSCKAGKLQRGCCGHKQVRALDLFPRRGRPCLLCLRTNDMCVLLPSALERAASSSVAFRTLCDWSHSCVHHARLCRPCSRSRCFIVWPAHTPCSSPILCRVAASRAHCSATGQVAHSLRAFLMRACWPVVGKNRCVWPRQAALSCHAVTA